MTVGACRAKHAQMVGRILMAADASGGRALEHLVDMAALALDVHVFTGQREGRPAGVEGRACPGVGPVTRRA
ncbi:MAG: hypothetical protein ACUVSS_15365, partial [Anaerolineae bacterium]